jgi:hypothetical protein
MSATVSLKFIGRGPVPEDNDAYQRVMNAFALGQQMQIPPPNVVKQKAKVTESKPALKKVRRVKGMARTDFLAVTKKAAKK